MSIREIDRMADSRGGEILKRPWEHRLGVHGRNACELQTTENGVNVRFVTGLERTEHIIIHDGLSCGTRMQ